MRKARAGPGQLVLPEVEQFFLDRLLDFAGAEAEPGVGEDARGYGPGVLVYKGTW